MGASLETLNHRITGFGEQKERILGDLLIPKEIYYLTQFLKEEGAKKENLSVLSGEAEEKVNILEFLDNNIPIPSGKCIFSVFEVLIELLGGMRAPLLPIEIVQETVTHFEQFGDVDDDVCQHMIFRLPKPNLHLFVYLLSFFKYLLAFSEYNGLTPERVCIVVYIYIFYILYIYIIYYIYIII